MQEIRKRPVEQPLIRMIGHGVNYVDYHNMCRRLEEGEDYPLVCEEIGDESQSYAERNLEKGHNQTASIFFLNASAMYRVGEYGLLAITDEKLRLYTKLLYCFDKGIRLSNKFKSERIELPYKDTKLNGWLLLPNGAPKDVPVVLIIPGWTGFKEEMYSAYATHLIEKGTAVCLIDGPGQGESLYFDHCFQEIEMERAYRVVLEFLKCHTELGEIGILGSSFGGYLCLRTAAYSADLITACVSKGGSSYPLEITTSVPYYMDKILVRWGKDTSEAEYMRTEVLPHMNLKGLGKKVTCPILFIHNEEDRLFDVNGIKQFYDEVSSKDKSLVVYPGKVHNAIEQDTEARCLLIDWFQEKLSNGGKL